MISILMLMIVSGVLLAWGLNGEVGIAQRIGQFLFGANRIAKGIAGIQPKIADREFAIVDDYLKKNLDNPNYEVVQWWPAIDREQDFRKQADLAGKDAKSLQKKVDDLKNEHSALMNKYNETERAFSRLKKELENKVLSNAPQMRSQVIKENSQEVDRVYAQLEVIGVQREKIGNQLLSAELELDESVRTAMLTKERIGKVYCRLRYREKNMFNAMTLSDEIFVLENGKVSEIISSSSRKWGQYAHLFDKP